MPSVLAHGSGWATHDFFASHGFHEMVASLATTKRDPFTFKTRGSTKQLEQHHAFINYMHACSVHHPQKHVFIAKLLQYFLSPCMCHLSGCGHETNCWEPQFASHPAIVFAASYLMIRICSCQTAGHGESFKKYVFLLISIVDNIWVIYASSMDSNLDHPTVRPFLPFVLASPVLPV